MKFYAALLLLVTIFGCSREGEKKAVDKSTDSKTDIAVEVKQNEDHLIASDKILNNICSDQETNAVKNKKYNFVIILTDDQRWDTLWSMPILKEKLSDRGVLFPNAFVSTPACCPYRASFLSGGYYSHNTGVLSNHYPNGGYARFKDRNSLFVLAQKEGYKTALIGKYLNKYNDLSDVIPPGYSYFITYEKKDKKDKKREEVSGNPWDNNAFIMGSSGSNSSKDRFIFNSVNQYVTDFSRDRSLDFIEACSKKPFLLLLSAKAPHFPAYPADQDSNLFSDFKYEGRATNEAELTDKPKAILKLAKRQNKVNKRKGSSKKASRKDFPLKQLRTLKAVDRAAGAIIDKLEELGLMDNTIFIFTSDNGMQWGEHNLYSKGFAYEESIRVPFIIAMPGVEPRVDDSFVVSNLDIGPTIYDFIGIKKKTDGLSLKALLEKPGTKLRDSIYIEHLGRGWKGIRNTNWKYVAHNSGEEELYDMVNDPFEKESLHNKKEFNHIKEKLKAETASYKTVNIVDNKIPNGIINENYEFKLSAWGTDEGGYLWSIEEGNLPEGLALDKKAGVIRGKPRKAGKYKVLVKVKNSFVEAYTGNKRAFYKEFHIRIKD